MTAGRAVSRASDPWRTPTSNITVRSSRPMPYCVATSGASVEVCSAVARMVMSPMRLTVSCCVAGMDAAGVGASLPPQPPSARKQEAAISIRSMDATSVVGRGKQPSAFGGGVDGARYEIAESTGFELPDRRLGGATGRGHATPQFGGHLVVL